MLPVQIKVKVKDPGASGVKEKIKVREVAPGEYEVEEKYKGPDGKTHVRTRAAVGDEIAEAAAVVHAPGRIPQCFPLSDLLLTLRVHSRVPFAQPPRPEHSSGWTCI